jgi:hypothetical protein
MSQLHSSLNPVFQHTTPDDVPDESVVEQSAAKSPSKLEQWWICNRKGVVSVVKTVLGVASKVLGDIPTVGSPAGMILDSIAKALENVEVIDER